MPKKKIPDHNSTKIHELITTDQIVDPSFTLSANQRSEIDKLKPGIRRNHEAFCNSARKAIEQAVSCGRLLKAAKEIVGHGVWETTFDFIFLESIGISFRTAQRYMKIATDFDRFVEKQTRNGQKTTGVTQMDDTLIQQFLIGTKTKDNKPSPDCQSSSWFPPEWLVEAARATMGSIDSDRSGSVEIASNSSEQPNENSDAEFENGRDWTGNVFLATGPDVDITPWFENAVQVLSHKVANQIVICSHLPPNKNWVPIIREFPFCLLFEEFNRTALANSSPKRKLAQSRMAPQMCVSYLSCAPKIARFANAFLDYGQVYIPYPYGGKQLDDSVSLFGEITEQGRLAFAPTVQPPKGPN